MRVEVTTNSTAHASFSARIWSSAWSPSNRLRIRLILGLRDDLNAAYEVQTALTS